MTVKVTERDDSHMSHEGIAAGIRIWDVHQQDCWSGCSTPRPKPTSTRPNWNHWSSNAKRVLHNHRIENDKPRHERGLSLLQLLTAYHIRSSGI